MSARYVGSENLEEQAKRLYKDNEYLQECWLQAVKYLREKSRRGWVLDPRVARKR